ncbi:MAG: hypothetical protein NTU97_02435 [Candidatus Magasanikbacteria bacterium]|nr:hypothetical protein [Candidatus Magasanikbacteria bacterium]
MVNEDSKRGVRIEVGTVLDLPADILVEAVNSKPSHEGPTLSRCTRLKTLSSGRYETKTRGGGLVLMLPEAYEPGKPARVEVTWFATNGKSLAAERLVA